jgi:hypothetical protein
MAWFCLAKIRDWQNLAYSGINWRDNNNNTVRFLKWSNEETFSTYTVQRLSKHNDEAAMRKNVSNLY